VLPRNVQSAQSFVRSTNPPARPPGLEGRLFTRLQLAIMREISGRSSGSGAAQLASWVAILKFFFPVDMNNYKSQSDFGASRQGWVWLFRPYPIRLVGSSFLEPVGHIRWALPVRHVVPYRHVWLPAEERAETHFGERLCRRVLCPAVIA
jgi:hypothetical protein